MKKTLTLIAIAASLTSTLAFASMQKAEKASSQERILLCKAVDKIMEIQAVDAGLDLKTCLTKSVISSRLVTEGVRTVVGQLTFNSPSRSGFKLTCSVGYYAEAKEANLIGGIESVICQ